MTVTSSNNIAIFTGNGVTTEFDCTFRADDSSHVTVYLLTIATGVTTALTLSTDFTLTGIGEETGFLVSYPVSGSPLPATHKLVVQRLVPYTQETDITAEDGWNPEVIENQLDLIVMQIQQLAEENARALRVGYGQTGGAVGLGEEGQIAVSDGAGNIEFRDGLSMSVVTPTTFMADGISTWDDAAEARTGLEIADINTVAPVWTSDLTEPAGDGAKAPFPLVALFKGEISLEHAYSGLTFGTGVTSGQRAINTQIVNQALADAGTLRRPLKGKAGATLEYDTIELTTDNSHFNLNKMSFRRGQAAATTGFYAHGTAGGARITNFRLYNGTIDGNGHNAGGAFYPLALLYHSECWLEELVILDPGATALYAQDAYPTAAGWPTQTSDNLHARDITVSRSTANAAAFASNLWMRQGDQIVFVGIYNPMLDSIRPYKSGRSGVSIGMCDGGYLRGLQSSECWSHVYAESWRNGEVSHFDLRNHMGHDGNAASAVNSYAMWFTDGDQSASGTGLPSCRNMRVHDGLVSSMVRTAATGAYKGICFSGRDGTYYAQDNIIENVLVQGVSATSGLGSAFTFDGKHAGAILRSCTASGAYIAFYADLAYTTGGGAAASGLTDSWVNNLNAHDCGYSAYASFGVGGHVRSGVRNTTGGGASHALHATLTDHSTNTW